MKDKNLSQGFSDRVHEYVLKCISTGQKMAPVSTIAIIMYLSGQECNRIFQELDVPLFVLTDRIQNIIREIYSIARGDVILLN